MRSPRLLLFSLFFPGAFAVAGCGRSDAPPPAAANAPVAAPAPVAGMPGARNVVLITVDTLRADHLGCYGYARRTSPNIDALCAKAWVFEQAYAITPRTGPSVASLHQGFFPGERRVWSIPKSALTLAERLAGRGYRTVAALDNANLSTEFGYAQGFQTYRETWKEKSDEIAQTGMITETALASLDGFAKSGEPFFIWLHYVNPHTPYTPPAEYAAPFVGDEIFQQETRVLRVSNGFLNAIRKDTYIEGERRVAAYIAAYDGEVAFADSHVGKVIDRLRSLPIARDTLVVVSADHGEALGEDRVFFKHGPPLTEPHIRVPLIFYREGALAEPRRIDTPVTLIDVAPTIRDALHVSAMDGAEQAERSPLAGRSVLPLMQGKTAERDPHVFFSSRDYWAVRQGNQKLIVQIREKAEVRGDRIQLYDLKADPDESKNLFETDRASADRLMRVLRQRMTLQEDLADEDEEQYKQLSEEALKNLRALGYIR
jgi:arylsulfatase A-like enzyme